jgi:DNA (cytosine-5)-methyltransferase 1
VFLVGCSRASGLDPAEILFERKSLRGHFAPGKKKRKDIAGTVADCLGGNCEGSDGFTLTNSALGKGVNNQTPLVAGTLCGSGAGTDRPAGQGNELDYLIPTLTGNPYGDSVSRTRLLIAHTLRGEGFDAGDDGCSRGTPLVPVAFHGSQDPDPSGAVTHPVGRNQGREACVAYCIQQGQISRQPQNGPQGKGWDEEICATIGATHHAHAVAFSSKDSGHDAGEIAPTLRSLSHDKSHANGGGQVAIVYMAQSQTGEIRIGEIAGALNTNSNASGRNAPTIMSRSAVRRLTPRECERLQGLPDDYTLVPYHGKPAADGPRYKAIGNGMCVSVVEWIFRRIHANRQRL